MTQLIKIAGWTDEPRANVVFVHGLGGHAYDTWRRGSNDQSFWPLWLAQDVEGVAVYTLSYAAPASNWLGTAMPLQDRAVNILESLLGEPSLRNHPITFICHSLGGLIVKQVMLDLHQQKGRRPEAAALLDQVTQVIFIATPHTGSRQATRLDWLRFLAWPSSVARTLVANDPTLRAINVAYRGLADERRENLRHRVFYETQGTPAGVIVDEASSDPGLPGGPPIPVDADHIRIAKPIDHSALVYVRTRDFVSEHAEQPRPAHTFIAPQLPAIRTEQSWNFIPKFVRIAAIIVVTTIAWQGVKTTIGVNEQKVAQGVADAQRPLADQLEKLATQVARDKGVEIAPLRAILLKMGEAGVRDEDIAKRLEDKADELIKLREETARLRQGPAELASFARQAQALIDKGDLDGARTVLGAGRTAARVLREQSSRYEAQFLAQEARVDHLQLAYRSAAAKYADAARLVAPLDQQQQWQFVLAQASELVSLGSEFGDNAALADAIDVYNHALLLAPRAQRPLDWAMTQSNLGNALWRLGERERGTAKLEEAVAAFREALKEQTRERVPLDWATTQSNLGLALWRLGEREGGTAKLEEAVAAYREALKEQTRERVPLDWAKTQTNLGNALFSLGERERGLTRLEEAVAAFREALKEQTRERVPLDWANSQTGLGNALFSLGERERGTAKLEEAVAAYREALKERTRKRVPLLWAATQNNLGAVLDTLGTRESGTTRLEEAVTAYRDALNEYTRERVPLDWAMTQNNLGNALRFLGERESGTGRLEEAVAAYREALKETTRERVPLDWASSLGNEGVALILLAERRGDAAMAETAVSQINTAFEAMRDGGHAPNAAYLEGQLSRARALVARLRGR